MNVAASENQLLTTRTWFYLILLGGLVLRFFVFLDIYQSDPALFVATPASLLAEHLYFTALTEHFWEYIWFSHAVTLATIFKDWFVFSFSPSDSAPLVNLMIVSIADLLATGLVYLALRNFNLPNWLAFTTTVLLSIRLLAWDVWFMSGSWDLFNPFMLALLVWSFSNYWVKKSPRSAFAIGGTGLFVVTSLQTAAVVAIPAIFLFILIASKRSLDVKAMSYALIPPLLMLGALVFKNGVQHGVYAPTSGAGQNIIQNLNLALTSPTATGALELGEKLNYPDWWAWCYREAERLGLWDQKNISGFYGTCNRSPKGYTYVELKKYLQNTNNKKILKIVEQDEKILTEKPWLFAGRITVRSTKFSAIYGTISSKLLPDVLIKYPRNFIGRSYLNFTYLIANGPRFEIDYPYVSKHLPKIVNKLSNYLVPVLRAGMYLSYFLTAFIPLWYIAGLTFSSKLSRPTKIDGIVWTLCVSFSFGTLANVTTHCCESYRHAFLFMPIIFTILVYFGYRVAAILYPSSLLKRYGLSSLPGHKL